VTGLTIKSGLRPFFIKKPDGRTTERNYQSRLLDGTVAGHTHTNRMGVWLTTRQVCVCTGRWQIICWIRLGSCRVCFKRTVSRKLFCSRRPYFSLQRWSSNSFLFKCLYTKKWKDWLFLFSFLTRVSYDERMFSSIHYGSVYLSFSFLKNCCRFLL
jgi:hypothetical protein